MSWMRKQGWGVVFGLAVSGFICSAVKAEDATPKAETQPVAVAVSAPAPVAPDNKPVLGEDKLIKALGADEQQGDNESRVIKRRETQGYEAPSASPVAAPAAEPAKAVTPTAVEVTPAPTPEPKHHEEPVAEEKKEVKKEKKKKEKEEKHEQHDGDVVHLTVETAAPTPAPSPAPVQASAPSTASAPLANLANGGLAPIAVTCWEADPVYKAKLEALKTKDAREQQEMIRRLIVRLASPGWAEAKEDLIKIGRPAVPHLIAAMSVPADPAEPYKYNVFNIQGPSKYVRQRPLAEAAYDVLDTLIRNHSNYNGAVPARDQADWQRFWAENGGSIALGFEK